MYVYIFLLFHDVLSQPPNHNSPIIIIKYGFHRAVIKLQARALVFNGSRCCYGKPDWVHV